MGLDSLNEAIAHFLAVMKGAQKIEMWGEGSAVMSYKGETYLVQFAEVEERNFHACEGDKWVLALKSVISRAVSDEVDKTVFVLENGELYWCYPALFKNYAEKYKTEASMGRIALPFQCLARIENETKENIQEEHI